MGHTNLTTKTVYANVLLAEYVGVDLIRGTQVRRTAQSHS